MCVLGDAEEKHMSGLNDLINLIGRMDPDCNHLVNIPPLKSILAVS